MNSLRKSLKNKRRLIQGLEREKKSALIARNLSRYLAFRRCKSFAIYISLWDEVATQGLIALGEKLGKKIYLPIINTKKWLRQEMIFAPYASDKTKFQVNRFGIAEPVSKLCECVRGTEIEFVCVPVVGFNDQCDRIGMGGGYYDRAFHRRQFQKSKLVGLAFSDQRADFFPSRHDVPMQAVITENHIIERKALNLKNV